MTVEEQPLSQKPIGKTGLRRKVIFLIIAGAVFCMLQVLVPVAHNILYGYELREYTSTLKADLKNALTAAQAYLADHPQAVVNSEAQLHSGGWEPLPGITLIRVRISCRGLNNESIVMHNSKLTRRISSKAREGLEYGQGEITASGETHIPEIRYTFWSLLFY